MCDHSESNRDHDRAVVDAQTAAARKAAQDALDAEIATRNASATVAAAGAAGTEKARKASEKKIRSMQDAAGFAPFAFGAGPVTAAPIGYRLATGA